MAQNTPVQEAAAGSAPVVAPKELEARLAEADADQVHVAVFFAHWCPYCRAFLPTLDEVEAPTDVAVVQVDISDPEGPGWDDHAIETIPTAVRYRDGAEVDRIEAVAGEGLDPEAFRAFLDPDG